MATAIADSPPAPAGEPGQPGAAAPIGPEQPDAGPPPEHNCAKCGAAMVPGQDWCLQCGAGEPGSSSSSWRSAATLIGLTVVLALGAAAAAFAALDKEAHKPATVTMTVAQAPAPTTSTPTTTATTPLPITPSVKTNLPTTAVKPPKIPLTATPTPKISTTPANTPTIPPPSSEKPATKTTPSSATGTEAEGSKPASILLDTDAASTYNPYNYPETDFGDPSLTIDGDPTTGWSALVEPATAPKMADGVLIDLKTPHKLAALELITPTLGMTVQVYATAAAKAPTSITDPAWIPVSHLQVISKKHVRIKLRDQKKSFTNVVLWISGAPAKSVGTSAAPGRVSVNEIELFPAP